MHIVRAGSYSALTDFQGEFLLSLPPGSYNLTITASGMEDETIPIEVNGDVSLGDLDHGFLVWRYGHVAHRRHLGRGRRDRHSSIPDHPTKEGVEGNPGKCQALNSFHLHFL